MAVPKVLNISCLVEKMAKSRLSMRREVEAAEAAEAGKPKKKTTGNAPKKATQMEPHQKNAKPRSRELSALKKRCSVAG